MFSTIAKILEESNSENSINELRESLKYEYNRLALEIYLKKY